MVKSSKELVEHKLKNPIYSEILIMMNKRKLSLSSFIHELDKALSTLVKQVYELERDGLVKRESIGDKNKQLFYIDFDRIVDEFFIYGTAHYHGVLGRDGARPFLKEFLASLFESYWEDQKYIYHYDKALDKKSWPLSIEGVFQEVFNQGWEIKDVVHQRLDRKEIRNSSFDEFVLYLKSCTRDRSFHEILSTTIQKLYPVLKRRKV